MTPLRCFASIASTVNRLTKIGRLMCASALSVVCAVMVLCAACLPGAAFAQPTQNESSPAIPSGLAGDTGLLVSVVDDHGGPLPEAEVALRLGERAERLVVYTDEDGRAEIVGLAAGEWQVDVRREGFMLFNAYVLLEAGKKPKVAFSSRQRTGSYWEPLQAVFLPPGVGFGRGVASGRESIKQAQQRAEKATKDSRRQERRAARAADKGRMARVVPSDTDPVQPVIKDLVERPAPASDVEEATVGTPSARSSGPETSGSQPSESEPSDEPAEAPSAEADPQSAAPAQPAIEPAQPRTAPAPIEAAEMATPDVALERRPAPELSEEPTEASEADASPITVTTDVALSPPPRLLRNPNLLPAGACPECGPGEFSVAVRGQAEKFERGDQCSLSRLDRVRDLAPRLNAALTGASSAFAGSLTESNGNDVLRLLPESLRTDLRAALADPSSSCQVIVAVLPAGARYIGFRYQAGERSVMAECPQAEPRAPQECQVGSATWLAPPSVVRTEGITMVLGVFENRSRRNTRLPRLVTYFQPPRGWLPPSR